MAIGVIGLPRAGQTALFTRLGKAHSHGLGHAQGRGALVGVARRPDQRPECPAALYQPRQPVYAAASGQAAPKEATYVVSPRHADAQARVAVCARVEAMLAAMGDAEAAKFLANCRLNGSGLVRPICKRDELLGLVRRAA
jgi:ribosome-binding ATPase YchF (GTP1/OBG family)